MLAAKLTPEVRGKLLAAMTGLKERAKTLVELIDGARFIVADRPIALDDKAAALLTSEARKLLGDLISDLDAVEPWSAADNRAGRARLRRSQGGQARQCRATFARRAHRTHHLASDFRRAGGARQKRKPRPPMRPSVSGGPPSPCDGKKSASPPGLREMRRLAAHTGIGYATSGLPAGLRSTSTSHPALQRAVRSAGRHKRGLDHGCEDRRQHQIRQIHRRRQGNDIPDLRWNDRTVGHRHQQVLRRDRDVHLRSRLHLDRKLRVQDHLYRRRRRRSALPRLSDRAAGRARRLSGDLLSPALRRAADRRAKGRFRQPCHPPYHGARADEPVLSGLPARRPPDGGDDRLRRRALRLLPRLHRHFRPALSA